MKTFELIQQADYPISSSWYYCSQLRNMGMVKHANVSYTCQETHNQPVTIALDIPCLLSSTIGLKKYVPRKMIQMLPFYAFN